MKTHGNWYVRGLRDGIPIALGYLAVAFTLGITARNAGFTAWQAMLTSFMINASAGEFVGFTLIAQNAAYIEVIIMEAVANARYLLMSCSLSQKLSPDTPLIHRLLIGYDVTDEIFGVSIAVPGKLDPFYTYGVMTVAIPGWAIGTFLGVSMGNILPMRALSALSVGLYGMFIAIFIPPARKNKVVAALVVISFAASYAFSRLDIFSGISDGIKTIILTVVISLAAAIIFPVKQEKEGAADEA
ncbi:MAG: AzlC family ABC transporter permease [Clostridia bacterium]|nr:AzlC family ABC transporter permease [Clostridia bacterium]